MHIKIGTRGSKLALWQANHVKTLLDLQGVKSDIVTIETKGDKILDVSISKIGSKGVFTEEIEAQLKNGHIDIAVHSAKDMQSTLPHGFEIIAFGEREKPNDVLIGKNPIRFDDDTILGTSSTRRIAFLKKLYPHIQTVPVRGNLQTRIQKMENGVCDALWLAYAGVHRMGYHQLIQHEFDVATIVPPVGQGSIAIECFENISDDKKQLIRKAVNHKTTETCLIAERAFLKKMDGGCSIPVFGYATIDNKVITLKGGIISLDGQKAIENTCASTLNSAQIVGETLADDVLGNGGAELLHEIRINQQSN